MSSSCAGWTLRNGLCGSVDPRTHATKLLLCESQLKSMNRSQRIVAVLYCLLVVYCCVWVPWYVIQYTHRIRMGYAWLWAAPSPVGTVDLPVIGLRLMAATALAAAAFLAAHQKR